MAPQARFEFGTGELRVEGLLELQQVIGGGEFALAPEFFQQVGAPVNIGTATVLPSLPGRERRGIAVNRAAAVGFAGAGAGVGRGAAFLATGLGAGFGLGATFFFSAAFTGEGRDLRPSL